jgi:hypothetical protein
MNRTGDATSISPNRDSHWPALPLAKWAETRDTLHMWTQIVGKLKVELAPFQNQLWHTALALTDRGLTTGPLPAGDLVFQADFDFREHVLTFATGDGGNTGIPLTPRSVAAFYEEVLGTLRDLHIDVAINPMPQEVPDPIPFPEDTVHASYDPEAVARWWRIMASSARVLQQHRSLFTGKASPVHFFWGGFDLAATRHNGEPHAVHPGKGYIYRVAENEANWAGGFWTGSGAIDYPAYYAYMVPNPVGFESARIEPAGAVWNAEMGEYILPYDVVRAADDPDAALMAFLRSTYATAADLSRWDRARLEISEIPRPR